MIAVSNGKDENQDLYIILTRLEGKVDTSLAIQASDISNLKADNIDKELRLRALEAKSTVTPGQLWTGILGAIAGASGIATLIRVLIP